MGYEVQVEYENCLQEFGLESVVSPRGVSETQFGIIQSARALSPRGSAYQKAKQGRNVGMYITIGDLLMNGVSGKKIMKNEFFAWSKLFMSSRPYSMEDEVTIIDESIRNRLSNTQNRNGENNRQTMYSRADQTFDNHDPPHPQHKARSESERNLHESSRDAHITEGKERNASEKTRIISREKTQNSRDTGVLSNVDPPRSYSGFNNSYLQRAKSTTNLQSPTEVQVSEHASFLKVSVAEVVTRKKEM